jgi:hypothetical protein
VCICRIIERTAGLETRDDLLCHLVRHTAPAQLLPDFVGRARTGGQVLQRGCLGRQKLLSGPEAHLVFHDQPTPYPQPPLAHEFLRDAEGKRTVQKDRHTSRLVLLHRQGCNGAGLHTCIEMITHARALLSPYACPLYCTNEQYSRGARILSRPYSQKGVWAEYLCCLPRLIPIQ